MGASGNGMASGAGAGRVVRVEVRSAPGQRDPIGEGLRRDAAALGVELTASSAAHVYLVQPARGGLSPGQIEAVRTRLLADPVTEASVVGAAPPASAPGARVIEVHPLPGVMDPVAQSVEAAIGELLGLDDAGGVRVATGWRYDIAGPGLSEADAARLATRLLANPVIHAVHTKPFVPERFVEAAGHGEAVREVALTKLGDEALAKLSREAHLFLSLEEMKAIQSHYRAAGREPREIELETLAQTWSEHCVHKTMKAGIRYRSDGVTKSRSDEVKSHNAARRGADRIDWSNRPGHTVEADGTVVIDNLLKSTVAAATRKLIADGVDWTLSVFVDNSGVIAFDESHAVCVKVETHNHPSAIEPYGGAATGAGGCIRDVIGTGLGARPVANTDVFCVGMQRVGSRDHGIMGSRREATESGSHDPLNPRSLPEGCLPPRRVLTQVVAGVRDYGNRMGIPTVNGAVYFDDRYVGNPLVFCGCVGVMGREHVRGEVKRGDLIVAIGGRTGRDGIHGATFSSAELEHTATDEFAHAVQIGNAITEKRVLDAILRARDEFERPLFHGLTDCGAGGFSSAIGEMGSKTGAVVHLDRAPLKYAGLSPTEVWISEAQERMVLAVPEGNRAALEKICAEESVEMAVLGVFESPASGEPELQLVWHGKEVGRLSMRLVHDGIPMPTREAVWRSDGVTKSRSDEVKGSKATSTPSLRHSVTSSLLALLGHPTIASKHWIVRQYDHEVRGGTAVKPLVGALGRGPGDASVIMPVAGSRRGLAIGCGLAVGIGDPDVGGDPYLMALAGIDECVRNLVCVGADPDRIAILDNFCWPSCAKPENLGGLVRAAEGCYDGALAYRTPFVSGKDSLNNQFTTRDGRTIEIPPTLLITGVGMVPDVERACTMDAKRAGNVLVLVGDTQRGLGGSVYQSVFGVPEGSSAVVSGVDVERGARTARAVAGLIREGFVASAHDVSDGGLLVAIAEMLIGGSSAAAPIGCAIDLRMVAGDVYAAAFGESASRYAVEVEAGAIEGVRGALRGAGVAFAVVGVLDESGAMSSAEGVFESVRVEEMARVWMGGLDW